MKEVESVIHLDDKVESKSQPKSQFNEYKYEAPSHPPVTQSRGPTLKSNLQKNQRKKPQMAQPFRRNMAPHPPQNQYYKTEPSNKFEPRPNEHYQNNQYSPHGNVRVTMPEKVYALGTEVQRQVRYPEQPSGRVTLPSRYEAQIKSTQEKPVYQGVSQKIPQNFNNNFQDVPSNNNQAMAELDEYQPMMYKPTNEPPFQSNPAPQTTEESRPTQEDEQYNIGGDISQISLPGVKSGVTLYQNMEEQEVEQPKAPKLVKKEFVFKYNSDKNGLFYFLGTRGGRREYVNPFDLGEVKVFFSSLAQGDYSNFVGRALTNCRTCNEENAFMGVDLGKER